MIFIADSTIFGVQIHGIRHFIVLAMIGVFSSEYSRSDGAID